MIQSLLLKSFIAVILLSFYSCGAPTTTETTTEVDPNTQVQQAVNAEANTDQENVEYAEKQEATNQAVSFYDSQKSGMYEKTSQLVDRENYPNFSEDMWLALLQKENETKGQVEKYGMQTSKLEILADGSKMVKMDFDVTRNGKKYKEELEFVKMAGQDSYLLREIEFEGASMEDDD